MTEQKVRFIEITQEQYDNSLKHSESSLYFCTDTGNMYKGDTLFSGGSGGNSDFVVTYTESDGTWTCDKTGNEIYTAALAGKNIIGRKVDGTDITYYQLIYVNDQAIGWCLIGFDNPNVDIVNLSHVYYGGTENINTWTKTI